MKEVGWDKPVFVTQTANKTTLGLISQPSRREFYLVNKEAFALQEAVNFAGEKRKVILGIQRAIVKVWRKLLSCES